MNELIFAIPTDITAFVATNLDDLVILTLLFSQVDGTFRCRHIVAGQYLGFTALVITSLLGFFGGLIIPAHWIGLLGLVPIAIGIKSLFYDNNDDDSPELNTESTSIFNSFFSPQTCGVAAITFANGSDNIGIYLPLFAKSSLPSLEIILVIFFTLVGVWCYLTYQLTRQPLLADFLNRYGNFFVPWVLIGLGSFIILDSQALNLQLLIVIATCLLAFNLFNRSNAEIESEA
jgi:cadmium resistance transport/sequestration family protein